MIWILLGYVKFIHIYLPHLCTNFQNKYRVEQLVFSSPKRHEEYLILIVSVVVLRGRKIGSKPKNFPFVNLFP
jgi:hypothetical protein